MSGFVPNITSGIVLMPTENKNVYNKAYAQTLGNNQAECACSCDTVAWIKNLLVGAILICILALLCIGIYAIVIYLWKYHYGTHDDSITPRQGGRPKAQKARVMKRVAQFGASTNENIEAQAQTQAPSQTQVQVNKLAQVQTQAQKSKSKSDSNKKKQQVVAEPAVAAPAPGSQPAYMVNRPAEENASPPSPSPSPAELKPLATSDNRAASPTMVDAQSTVLNPTSLL